MIEPKAVAQGSGWCVYRVGRSFCVQIARADAEQPAEVWMRRGASDMARTALLGALVAGTHGVVDRAVAMEAMGAEW